MSLGRGLSLSGLLLICFLVTVLHLFDAAVLNLGERSGVSQQCVFVLFGFFLDSSGAKGGVCQQAVVNRCSACLSVFFFFFIKNRRDDLLFIFIFIFLKRFDFRNDKMAFALEISLSPDSSPNFGAPVKMDRWVHLLISSAEVLLSV